MIRVDERFFVGVNIGETAPSKSAVEHERARYVPPFNFYSASIRRGKKKAYDVIVRSHGTLTDVRAAAIAAGREPLNIKYIGSDIGQDAKSSVLGLSVSVVVTDGVWHVTGEESDR